MKWSCILTSMILSVGTLYSLGVAAQAVDPSPLVNGVGSIWMKGSPGPLLAMGPDVIPVVAGDDDTSFPSLVVVATGWGQGRIVACGHSGFLENEAVDGYNNKRFAFNIMDWLDKTAKRRILVTQGHREWFGGDNFSSLQASLQQRGYTCTRSYGTLSTASLANVGVVIIGIAWGAFTANEITLLDRFVDAGGGLLLLGLGWSWEPYNPGYTLDDYPMNVIGQKYGIRWVNGLITDPTNAQGGSPIFHVFHPDTGIQTISQAFGCMEGIAAAHPADLPGLLQSNDKARLDFLKSLLLLRTITAEHNTFDALRQEIYDFYATMVARYPQYFDRNIAYDAKTENVMAWIREGLYRSFIDTLALTPERRTEIATLLGLTGRYLDIWEKSSVLLLDNTSLNSRQLDFIYNLLSLVPPELHNLCSISVRDLLGAATTPKIPLSGLEGSVNIFGVDIGGYNENSFPGDVAPGIVDGFSIVVAHELNHVVDANYIANHTGLKQRRDALIAAAGTNPTNYLRSMFEPGFFANAPQEFFASIANEWFTDSAKTVELGIVRLRNGVRHPIEQALFFADVYSMGRGNTYFYTIDAQGNINKYSVDVVRNARGDITVLQTAQVRYEFTWGDLKTVIDARIAEPKPIEPSVGLVPVARWPFDESSGAVAVDIVGGNNAQVLGAKWTDGHLGGALQFDGQNDSVDCGKAASLAPAQCTISFWVRPGTHYIKRSLLRKSGWGTYDKEHDVSLTGNGQVVYAFGNGTKNVSVQTTSKLTANQWSHVAVRRDGSEAAIYINGAKAASASYSFVPADNGRNLILGGGTTDSFTGKLDDVRIYDQALDKEEIIILANET